MTPVYGYQIGKLCPVAFFLPGVRCLGSQISKVCVLEPWQLEEATK